MPLRETDLDFAKLEALEEWDVLTKHLFLLERDYIEYALKANTMELKELYRGKVEMIREVLLFPKMTKEDLHTYLGLSKKVSAHG